MSTHGQEPLCLQKAMSIQFVVLNRTEETDQHQNVTVKHPPHYVSSVHLVVFDVIACHKVSQAFAILVPRPHPLREMVWWTVLDFSWTSAHICDSVTCVEMFKTFCGNPPKVWILELRWANFPVVREVLHSQSHCMVLTTFWEKFDFIHRNVSCQRQARAGHETRPSHTGSNQIVMVVKAWETGRPKFLCFSKLEVCWVALQMCDE